MTHKIIAIDGPSASGKGTLARKLAAHLSYAYLDTGALYRAIGKAVLTAGGNPENEEDAIRAAQSLASTLKPEDLQDPLLRTDDIGQAASKVGKFQAVRTAMLRFQQDFAAHPPASMSGVVLDGRDIGTVICPNADVKLFVTASTKVRSQRRFAELTCKGIKTTYEAVLADMIERDARDSERTAAPLKPAEDAHILDTSEMNAEEAMEKVMAIILSIF